MPIVIFGIGSPIVDDVAETCRRLALVRRSKRRKNRPKDHFRRTIVRAIIRGHCRRISAPHHPAEQFTC